MIRGIGTDIVAIARIEQALARQQQRFIRRILTPNEQARCPEQQQAAWVAKRFASKEAVVKALGTGFQTGIGFHDIETGHDAFGRPTVCLQGAALARMQALQAHQIDLSLSDERDYAVAFVVLSG